MLNAQHLKKVPGRKTDVTDSEWIAELVAHRLVRPSFVPPRPIRRLRDLTRYRTALTQDRTREVQRLQNTLEDAGIKLDAMVSDITGTSPRRMLAALIAGERDPQTLAELALGRMRPKVPDLQRALVGHFDDHHARLCAKMLAHIDELTAMITELTGEIDIELEPFHRAREQLSTIPGVSHRIAEVIIAETGADMGRFPTPQQLASWAGICPGNNESAGRHFTGRTRKGDRWLRGALGEAAAAASRTRNTYLSTRYRRLASRRGKKKAQVAIGHDILLASWYILTRDVAYQDLGGDYFDTHVIDRGHGQMLRDRGHARRVREAIGDLPAGPDNAPGSGGWTIGELARRLLVTPATLRKWESAGVLGPPHAIRPRALEIKVCLKPSARSPPPPGPAPRA